MPILQKPGRLDPRSCARCASTPTSATGCSRASACRRWTAGSATTTSAGTASGYPLGLAGEEIPLGSRIILVADTFDAMTSDRCLPRRRHASGAARRDARRSWTQFDARVVAALETYLASDTCHLGPLEITPQGPRVAEAEPTAEAA